MTEIRVFYSAVREKKQANLENSDVEILTDLSLWNTNRELACGVTGVSSWQIFC